MGCFTEHASFFLILIRVNIRNEYINMAIWIATISSIKLWLKVLSLYEDHDISLRHQNHQKKFSHLSELSCFLLLSNKIIVIQCCFSFNLTNTNSEKSFGFNYKGFSRLACLSIITYFLLLTVSHILHYLSLDTDVSVIKILPVKTGHAMN